ncbi:MAG TPA: anaerobic glycerol-3-phosphate dehydrogenase subunit GlpA [Acidimicrobiia bacterium]|nr:anaerobic glycerol-3-phosphate dehydrogenase subunit GlpA [Acidimicrobiia bacterium]
MRRLQTEVLVIGGGATGTGAMRDLAMRGFETILVEQRDLTHGTTGRYHGLLHSGGRYVVKDPEAAVECIEENRVLRRIMPHCIEETSGFFVLTPWDDEAYVPEFLAGCRAAGIPVDEVPRTEALRREPYLNPAITHCFEVPDAAADSFLAAESTVASAREHGARFLPYHEVETLIRTGDRVVGARCHDLVSGEVVEIAADMVVNAAGAWAGRLAHTAGIEFTIHAGKGTMIAVNHRMLNTIVNRCKMPDDGDIIVPIRTVAVIGTTDEGVADPERFAVEPWEIRLMLEEGDKLVPGISETRVLRAWAGVRPLFEDDHATETRDITRAYALLDHATRDGVNGLLTITGGKWTTFRQMAEVTVDAVCSKLGVDRACRTHLEPLPDRRRRRDHHWLGERLARVEAEESYGDLVCECELATRADVEFAIRDADAKTIDDVRREVRLGMGPCQGGWCLPRVTGILHELRPGPVVETNVALRDFLHERWKGMLPILWGSQLRQARLDDLIFQSVLSVPALVGASSSPLGPVMYEDPDGPADLSAASRSAAPATTVSVAPDRDVIVVGGGLAGLIAAWRAAAAGAATTLLTKGWGSLIWHAGSIDVLGYLGAERTEPVTNPAAALSRLPDDHPYALAADALAEAADAIVALCASAGYPLVGSLDANLLVPGGLGAPRSTCLVPSTMVAGDLNRSDPMLVVGLERFGDFFPDLVAANLTAGGIPTEGITVRIPELSRRRFVTGSVLAGLFDDSAFREAVAAAVVDSGRTAPRIGFPAVLGMHRAGEVIADLEARLGAEVFEIPVLPPSIPGMRLQRILRDGIRALGGTVIDNAGVVEVNRRDGRLEILTEAAARRQQHRAKAVVVATGGLLGGGVVAGADGALREVVAGLEVSGPNSRAGWFGPQTHPGGHAVYRAGVRPGPDLSAADGIYVAGGLLAGADPIEEESLEGIALATGWVAGRNAAVAARGEA